MLLLIPIAYFLTLFGFYEGVLFKRRIDYWHASWVVCGYFALATCGALVFISSQPLTYALAFSTSEILAIFAVFSIFLLTAARGRFAFIPGGEGSMGYALAKSADIVFQNTMAIIVAHGCIALFGTVLGGVVFAAYFCFAHLLLLFILPARYALIFASAALIGGAVLALASAVEGGFGYVLALHLLFYVASYPYIRRVRMRYLRLE